MFAPIHKRTAGGGWLGVARGLTAACPRHGEDRGRSALAACEGQASQSVHQDPGNPGGSARHRGGHIRRVCRSTSRCCSRATTTCAPPMPICAASSGAWRPAWTRTCGLSLRYSSAAGTRRHWRECRRSFANELGIAVSQQSYKAYRRPAGVGALAAAEGYGARPQRLLFASTSTKDPQAPDVLYVGALAAPNTVNTMPEETLLAFAEHGAVDRAMPRDGGDAETVLVAITRAGVDLATLARQLQDEGAKGFVEFLEGSAGGHRDERQGAGIEASRTRRRRGPRPQLTSVFRSHPPLSVPWLIAAVCPA